MSAYQNPNQVNLDNLSIQVTPPSKPSLPPKTVSSIFSIFHCSRFGMWRCDIIWLRAICSCARRQSSTPAFSYPCLSEWQRQDAEAELTVSFSKGYPEASSSRLSITPCNPFSCASQIQTSSFTHFLLISPLIRPSSPGTKRQKMVEANEMKKETKLEYYLNKQTMFSIFASRSSFLPSNGREL